MLAKLGITSAESKPPKWVARCPSGRHEDRDPSWEIFEGLGNEKNGLHHCFSCKYGGTATDLVMKVMGFVEPVSAIDWLRDHAMRDETPILGVSVRVRPLYRPAFKLPPEVKVKPFEAWPTLPRRYVLSRGITPEQVIRWDLGYALDGRLGGRIIFPAHDGNGVIGSYSARTFIDDPKRYTTPNLNERPNVNIVYGEKTWPELAERYDILITEGAINALALERVLARPFGSLEGSHIHLGQIAKIATFKRAFIITDPDPAGDRAAEMLIDSLVNHLDECIRIRLPRKKVFGRKGKSHEDPQSMDPDELKAVFEPWFKS